jgi:hypothetical protein
MNDTQNQPLWRVMEGAFLEGRNPGFSDRHGYAAEIRAVANWLVPEEVKPNDEFCIPPVHSMLWQRRQALRHRLLAEADRAERGER